MTIEKSMFLMSWKTRKSYEFKIREYAQNNNSIASWLIKNRDTSFTLTHLYLTSICFSSVKLIW